MMSNIEVDEDPADTICVKKDGDSNDVENQVIKNIKLRHDRKKAYIEGDDMCDPFVRADSFITNGHAKMVVCCTGEKSTRGKI